MMSEWLDIAIINYGKMIMYGQVDEHTVEQVLTDSQQREYSLLVDVHNREMFKLLKGFIV